MSSIRPGFPYYRKEVNIWSAIYRERGKRGVVFTSFWGSLCAFPKLFHVDVRNDFIELAGEEEEWYSSYFGHEVYGSPFFAAKKRGKVI